MKKTILILITLSLIFTGCTKSTKNNEAGNKAKSSDEISIVVTNFPCYDFVRSVISGVDKNYLASTGDNGKNHFGNINLHLLIKPGMETHSYDPTPADIITLEKADLFIGIGGPSEKWAESILQNSEIKGKVLQLKTDVSDLDLDLPEHHHHEEDDEEGEHEEEDHNEHHHDEHIWTNSKNAVKMIKKISEELISIDMEKNDGKNVEAYKANTENYINQIENLSNEIQKVIDNSETKFIVMGDRFPFKHFAKEHGLNYEAAFDGCSSAVEAKTSKIAELINLAKEYKVPAIFAIEMSNQKIAQSIAEATNTKVLELHSCQNVRKDEFEMGITYAYTMNSNLSALKEGLR